jgi:hypothetical protein
LKATTWLCRWPDGSNAILSLNPFSTINLHLAVKGSSARLRGIDPQERPYCAITQLKHPAIEPFLVRGNSAVYRL